MAFTFRAGDLARGCVNTQLLILPSVGLVMVWTIRPIGKNEVSEGLEIQFSFPCGTEDAVRSSVSHIRQQLHRLDRVHIGDL